MLKRMICLCFLMAVSSQAFSSTIALSEKDFQRNGAIEFLGEIASVDITSSDQGYESGIVTINVKQVIFGKVPMSTFMFPFTRALIPSDSPANWDLIAPLGKSLATEQGKKLLLHVAESNGTYQLFPATDSVQKYGSNLLLGAVHYDHRDDGSGSSCDRDELEVHVDETVIGWVEKTDVCLPVADARSMREFLSSSPEQGDRDDHREHRGGKLLIYTVDGRITRLSIADKTVLTQIQIEDEINP